MQDFIPNIYFYAGLVSDAHSINIIIEQLNLSLNKMGLKVNFGVYYDDLNCYLNKKKVFLFPTDKIIYYFSNHILNKADLEKPIESFLSNADKAYICCWPYANIRPYLDENFANIGNDLSDIIAWIVATFKMDTIVKQ